MVIRKYSKPSKDIKIELNERSANNDLVIKSQLKISRAFDNCPLRTSCILCKHTLMRERSFKHRGVEYMICGNCKHMQSSRIVDLKYPFNILDSGFESQYPQLDLDEYISRTQRIYQPKLDWILELIGCSNEHIDEMSWLDIGCGAGYFIKTLLDNGFTNVKGVDSNKKLIKIARNNCGNDNFIDSNDMFIELRKTKAKIITAFFVLEHIYTPRKFWEIMAEKPSGTYFAFSVPVLSFCTLIEGAFPDFPARHLDNVYHTQLYTDDSINYSLETFGYERVGEWIFGQDAQDLCSLLMKKIQANSKYDISNIFSDKLDNIVDSLQSAIDHSHFSDARHVLAVKR